MRATYSVLPPKVLSEYMIVRLRVVEMLGGRCVNCGNNDTRVLEINHVHNDANLHLRKINAKTGLRANRSFRQQDLMKILNGKDPLERYEALCSNCHVLRTKGYI